MKKTTLLTVLGITGLALAACNDQTADAVKEKADDAKQAVEAKSEEAKDAAAKKIDEAKEKAKEAAPAAAAAVDNMPRIDQSYLRQRVALAYYRALGVPSQCANNGRLFINGAFYGLYTNMNRSRYC